MFALAIATCLTVAAPALAADGNEPDASATELKLDEQFDQVAHQVPEFAGLYLQGDTVVVWVTDGSQDTAATAWQVAVDVLEDSSLAGRTFQAKRAEFSWLQLRDWYATLASRAWTLPSVAFIDIDEARNIIVVGAGDTAAVSTDMDQWAADHGIPAKAFAVIRAMPAEQDPIVLSRPGPGDSSSVVGRLLIMTGVVIGGLVIAFRRRGSLESRNHKWQPYEPESSGVLPPQGR